MYAQQPPSLNSLWKVVNKHPEVLSKHLLNKKNPHFFNTFNERHIFVYFYIWTVCKGAACKNIIISLGFIQEKKILCVRTRTRADPLENRLQRLLLYSTVISVGKLFYHPTHCNFVISYIVLCYLSKCQSKPAFRVFLPLQPSAQVHCLQLEKCGQRP